MLEAMVVMIMAETGIGAAILGIFAVKHIFDKKRIDYRAKKDGETLNQQIEAVEKLTKNLLKEPS